MNPLKKIGELFRILFGRPIDKKGSNLDVLRQMKKEITRPVGETWNKPILLGIDKAKSKQPRYPAKHYDVVLCDDVVTSRNNNTKEFKND